METFFLGCFLFGAIFAILSLALGFFDGPLHLGPLGHHDLVSDSAGHAAVGPGDATAGGVAHAGGTGLPIVSLTTLLAFLTWFGAGGYLALRVVEAPMPVAAGAGLAAGAVAALLMARFLGWVRAHETVLDARDFEIVGTLARVSISIPAGGVGEIVFTKAGTRRGEAARSRGAVPLARDTEVVVMAYERGIAYVQPWEELLDGGAVNKSVED